MMSDELQTGLHINVLSLLKVPKESMHGQGIRF